MASAPPPDDLGVGRQGHLIVQLAVSIIEPDDGHRFKQFGPTQAIHLGLGQHGQQPVHAVRIGCGQLEQADVLGQKRGHEREHGQRRHVARHPHADQPVRLGGQVVSPVGDKTVEIGKVAVKVQFQKRQQICASEPCRQKSDAFKTRRARIGEQAVAKGVEQRQQPIDRHMGEPAPLGLERCNHRGQTIATDLDSAGCDTQHAHWISRD